jgi:hypothetical protein
LKKTYSIIAGLIAGLLSVLFLDQLFKGLLANLFLNEEVKIYFTGLRLTVYFPTSEIHSFFLYAVLIISPFILSILMVEATLIWHNKIPNNYLRMSIIIFQLINIGYLIFTAVIGLFSILLHTTFQTDWSMLLNHGSLSYDQKLLFMFLILFIFLGYINILTKRIRKSIPIIGQK